ncbi:MAG: preprotein translocase subunit YajC [Nocardioides sp.]
MQDLVGLLPIIGIALLFWLLIIRPQSRRQKAVRAMQSELEPGAEVMLSSGIFGTLEQVEDDHVRLRVADGVTLKVIKNAVANVVPPADEHVKTAEPTDTTTETAHPAERPIEGP